MLYSLGDIFIAKSKAFAVSPELYLQFAVSIQTNKQVELERWRNNQQATKENK